MEERYLRNIGALNEEECAELRRKTVFVAGCGGLGGYITEFLARLGIGNICAADGDVFEQSNLNRQLLSKPGNLGTMKAKAAKERVAEINPDVNFRAVPVFITDDNAEELIRGCDIVMDALDNIASRKALKSACDKLNIPYVYGAICGWTVQAGLFLPGDEVLNLIYPHNEAKLNKTSLSFTPALCAAAQCAICTKVLCGRPTEHGKIYIFDLMDFDFEKICFE